MSLKSLPKTVRDAAASPVGEHILNIIKAILSTAPGTGGMASLMTDYIPTRRQQRLEEFAERLAADLARLQDRVREETILTDQFALSLLADRVSPLGRRFIAFCTVPAP